MKTVSTGLFVLEVYYDYTVRNAVYRNLFLAIVFYPPSPTKFSLLEG
jgi:hypothetical protein